MTDVTIRWPAATDADASTDYQIDSDETTSGTFAELAASPLNSTDRGDGSYVPYETTLDGALTAEATSLTMTDATNFADGDYIIVDKEMILLAGKASNTFSGVTRGVGGTIPQAHLTGAAVYAVHESHADTPTYAAERYVIRYRVTRVQGSDASVAAEATAVNPPLPPTNNLITLWGVMEDIQGNPEENIAVQLAINEADDYGQDTGEGILKTTESAQTDADGFFFFYVRRDVAHVGGGVYTLTINNQAFTIAELPDQEHVNYLEAVA
jgi:hypothetical protein